MNTKNTKIDDIEARLAAFLGHDVMKEIHDIVGFIDNLDDDVGGKKAPAWIKGALKKGLYDVDSTRGITVASIHALHGIITDMQSR